MSEDFPRAIKGNDEDKSNLKRKIISDNKSFTRKKLKLKSSNKNVDEYHFKPFTSHIEQNMLVLGCVKEIRDYEVIVDLPDNIKGKFSITEISDTYTNVLKKLASGNFNDEDCKPLGLQDIFNIGSLVKCCIIEFNHDSKKNITLSVKPSLVNQQINEFKQGSVIPTVVFSCEDHGYLLDIGHKNINAFLPKHQTTEYLKNYKSHYKEELSLSIGSYLSCIVQTSKKKVANKNRSIELSLSSSVNINDFNNFSLSNLLPGSLVKCTVKSIEDSCVIVNTSSFEGIIFRKHLLKGCSKYVVEEELVVTVLYIQPSTKFVVLSELKHLTAVNSFIELFSGYNRGDVLDAKLVRISFKDGLDFKISNNLKGFVSKKHISDSKKVNFKKFVKNQLYKVRIIGFDYLSGIVILSMKKSVLDQEFYNYSDLKTGSILDCCVEKFVNKGVKVKVMGHITGLIPFSHMSDIPLLKPEKTFTHGKRLKCKILYVNAEDSNLILTNKKSLVKSKNLVPSSYAELSIGQNLTGFIGSIRDNGLVIVFCDEVKGWAPKDELSYGDVSKLSEMFFIGQVVQCRVLKMASDKKRLLLSLKVLIKNIEDENASSSKNKMKNSEINPSYLLEKLVPKKTQNVHACLVLPTTDKFDWENEKSFVSEISNGKEESDEHKKKFMKKMKNQLTSAEEQRLLLERDTLLHPSDSSAWLQLIAFEIENVSIDKAREVIQRALKTIPYREDNEKLNIWVSFINLEFKYGNEETLKVTIDEAMKQCEQIKIFNHLRDMYESAGKHEKSLEICGIIAKKFKHIPDTWVSYGKVLYNIGEYQKARKLLAECLEKLDKRYHIEVTTKFALLESKHGAIEESERLFKGIIDNFPRRNDIWLAYTDMLVKHSLIDKAREAYKKFLELEIPSKKKKSVLKKFINFEELHGNEETKVEAKEYLEKEEHSLED